MSKHTLLSGVCLGLALTHNASAVILGLTSAPGEVTSVQAPDANFGVLTTEDFAGSAQSSLANSGTFSSAQGTYSILSGGTGDADIRAGGPFGSDGSEFLSIGQGTSVQLSLANSVQYLGFSLSAVDIGNQIDLFNNGGLVLSFDAQDIIDFFPNDPTSTVSSIGDGTPGSIQTYNTQDYFGFGGTPGSPFIPVADRDNNNEIYTYINLFALPGSEFDEVRFSQTDEGRLEIDNIATIDVLPSGTQDNLAPGDIDPSFVNLTTVVPVTAVPEPSSYAALAGVLVLGFAAIKRRRK